MSTTQVETWATDLGQVGPIYPWVGAEAIMFIAAVVLFIFGTGPVKGFAVTLSIGIVTSMFTAIMVTRLQVAEWVRRKHLRPSPTERFRRHGQ